MNDAQAYPYTTYDTEADAVYVYLGDASWALMEIVDDYRNIDFAADGLPLGVEFLYVSKGINLDGLPAQDVLAAQLEALHLKVFA